MTLTELRKRLIDAKSAKRALGVDLEKRSAEELELINAQITAKEEEIKKLEQEIAELEAQAEEEAERAKKVKMQDERSQRKMTEEERRKLYERAWAKHYLSRKMTDEEKKCFDVVNKRALGVATTTTATEYVSPTADVDGVNNGGVFIPETISMAVMQNLERTSPFYTRVRRLYIRGNVNFPYEATNSGANWYAEGTCTLDQSIEFRTLSLNGYELAKYIRITWKLEAMSIDGFISYIINELTRECGKALINAVLYGTGINQPTGATVGAITGTYATATEGLIAISSIFNYDPTSPDQEIADPDFGAIAFMSKAAYNEFAFTRNSNGDFVFPPSQEIVTFGSMPIMIDPYLRGNSILYGNPNNYLLNEQEPIGTMKEADVKCRVNGYSAYGIFDGKPLPNMFAYYTKQNPVQG